MSLDGLWLPRSDFSVDAEQHLSNKRSLEVWEDVAHARLNGIVGTFSHEATTGFTNTAYQANVGPRGHIPWKWLRDTYGATRLFVKLMSFLKNQTAGQTTFMRLVYQKNDTSVVTLTGTEISVTGTTWAKKESDWVNIWDVVGSEEDLPQCYSETRVSGGTGEAAAPSIAFRVE